MSDQDRGAYTPPADPPLSFDARQPVRGSRPVPLTLIVSAVVLILLIGAIVMFYRSGVRQAGEAPQTVGSPVAEMREAPPIEEQPADPAAGLQIYQAEDGTEAAQPPKFTPPPEAPAARPAPTSPVTSAPLALPPAQPAPKVATAPPPKAPATPAAKPAAPPPPKTITAALEQSERAAAAPPAATAGAAAMVQIGAFASAAQADEGWNAVSRVVGGAISGKSKRVEPIERDGQTLYRTSVAGFSTRADAQDFCARLKAAGRDCFVR